MLVAGHTVYARQILGLSRLMVVGSHRLLYAGYRKLLVVLQSHLPALLQGVGLLSFKRQYEYA